MHVHPSCVSENIGTSFLMNLSMHPLYVPLNLSYMIINFNLLSICHCFSPCFVSTFKLNLSLMT